MTRLLLCSDEPILAQGLESALRQVEGFELLPVCTNVTDLLQPTAMSAPDLILIDLTPEVSFEMLSVVMRALNHGRMMLWVHTISTELAFQSMGLGIRGILRKNLPIEVQMECLRNIRDGQLWFEKTLTDSLLCARRVPLTHRESQLVSLLSQGLKNKEVASILSISEGTVKVYLSRLFQKLGVKDRFELALFGLKNLATLELTATEKSRRFRGGPVTELRSLVVDKPSDMAGGARFAMPIWRPPT